MLFVKILTIFSTFEAIPQYLYRGGECMSELMFEDDLKKLLEECKNMVTAESYVKDEYTKERDREIRLAAESGVDLEPYVHDEYTGFQLHEIRIGLEEGLDVRHYNNTGFSWEQMRQIRKGLEAGIDVSVYADPLYSNLQMREIRRGLEEGVDTYSYAKLIYSTADMRQKRAELFSAKYYADPCGFGKNYTDCETGIEIRLTDDLMEAYVKLPKGCNITENEIYALLEDHDITFGYISGNIKLLAEKGSAAGEVLAAKGEQLRKGCDGSYKMLWRKFEPPTPHVRKDGTMDFATVDFVDMVKTGQPVAVYTPAVKGRDGRTVDGMVIEEESGKELPPLTGRSIALQPDRVTYVAGKDGYVIFDENKYTLEIQDVLIIRGNVNRLYGNVFYDGTVRVKGNVGEGAIISAKGDVIVEGYIQSAYVSSGNNVVVIGGVNANDSGYISAQGGVYAEYLENAVVYAGRDVKANYILTSKVEAGNEIIVKGSKGVICGGELTAGYKITAQSLGNRGFVKTVLTVGKSARMNERLVAAKAFRSETERDINTLKKGAEHLRHTLPPHQLEKNDMYIKLGIAIQMKEQSLSRVNDDINEIEAWIHNTDRVSVNVPGTAYPNSEIHINDVTRLLDSDIFNVTFLQAGDTIITKKFI